MRFASRLLAFTMLAGAAPLAAQEIPQGKLPGTATPSAYRLDLTIVPEKDRFSGHTEIDIDLKQSTSSLFLHGRDLNVTKAVIRAGGKTIPVTYHQVDPLGVAKLDFASMAPAGKATLVFDYDAPFGSSASGLYHIKVADKWYAWTQFESIDARAAFPGFDEPGFKTPFTVSLTVPEGETALSNAPETGSSKSGAMVTHRFAATKPLPTYLVAFVAGPMAVADTQAAPTEYRKDALPIRIVATQPNKDKLGFAAENSGPIVDLLERYFGEPFPFPKLDQIASPVMGGAMENAGADIYDDTILMLDQNPPVWQQKTFGMVVAHELAHQWFGDLVTPKWWDDIWLNESFANWMGYRIGNEWRPDLNIGAGAIDEAFQAMTIDALAAGRPIHQPIATNAEIDSAFDAVTYGKGGQVVAMIAAYLGDEKFQQGVRLHLKRHAYGNADTEEFFTSLADAAKDPRIVASLKSFVDQQGVPVISAERTPDGLKVTQARYHLLGSELPAQNWIIPVCAEMGKDRQCTLLDKPSAMLPLKGDGAIIPNAGGTGYYRFSLSDAEWEKLITAGPALPPGEALALNDSLWADMSAGHAAPALLVKAARAMTGNGYAEAATEGATRLKGLRRRGLIPQSEMGAYRTTLGGIYAPMLEKLGFDPRADAYAKDDPEERTMRENIVSILSGEAQDKDLNAKLVSSAKAWLGGDETALDSSYLGSALGAYVAQGGAAVVPALFEHGLATEDSLKRGYILRAIGGSGDPAIASWLFAH